MRIGLTVGALGSGGAEKQLMRLSLALHQAGHEVQVYCYAGASVFDAELREQGVKLITMDVKGRIAKIRQMRRWIKSFSPDIVHASMKRASVLAILARGISRDIRVLASDMSTATYNRRSMALWPSLLLFGAADGVVTQTELNRRSLETLAPWLRGRVAVVRNGLDIIKFQPQARILSAEPFRFCIIGSVYGVKNPALVVAAVAELRRRGVDGFRVDWYGRRGLGGDSQPSSAYLAAVAAVDSQRLHPWLSFQGETKDIQQAYHSAHTLIHVSLQEGFPNAVVEAMACGLPIIGSDVSDLPLVVEQAQNGCIVDAKDACALADAMVWMMEMEAGERVAMGKRSRELAVRWFNEGRFLKDYLELYRSICQGWFGKGLGKGRPV